MPSVQPIIGESLQLRKVLEQVDLAAPSDVTIHITGENGTGKGLIAREIHRRSPRRDQQFVHRDLSTFPSTLVESTLFGHEKGAFTGASGSKLGVFQLAHRGTLFLDEVGNTSAETQTKLLRVLEERQFERVGGTETISVNVRVITATNRNLKAAVKSGTFREDLYFRLAVFPIEMPPLRDRSDDIPLLANYYLKEHARHQRKAVTSIATDALDALIAYQWPGNIRELTNTIERAVVLCRGQQVTFDHLPSIKASLTENKPSAGDQLIATLRSVDLEALSAGRCNSTLCEAAERDGFSVVGRMRNVGRELAKQPELVRRLIVEVGPEKVRSFADVSKEPAFLKEVLGVLESNRADVGPTRPADDFSHPYGRVVRQITAAAERPRPSPVRMVAPPGSMKSELINDLGSNVSGRPIEQLPCAPIASFFPRLRESLAHRRIRSQSPQATDLARAVTRSRLLLVVNKYETELATGGVAALDWLQGLKTLSTAGTFIVMTGVIDHEHIFYKVTGNRSGPLHAEQLGRGLVPDWGGWLPHFKRDLAVSSPALASRFDDLLHLAADQPGVLARALMHNDFDDAAASMRRNHAANAGELWASLPLCCQAVVVAVAADAETPPDPICCEALKEARILIGVEGHYGLAVPAWGPVFLKNRVAR